MKWLDRFRNLDKLIEQEARIDALNCELMFRKMARDDIGYFQLNGEIGVLKEKVSCLEGKVKIQGTIIEYLQKRLEK